MRLSENLSPVYVLKPGDYAAGVDGDSINMGLLHRVTFLLQFAALTGNSTLTLNSGATAGTKTTAETFRYRLADAVQGSAGADQFGDWQTSSGLTLTAATYTNKLLVVEIDARELTKGQPWLTLSLSAATALNTAVVALGEPRYLAHDKPTVI